MGPASSAPPICFRSRAHRGSPGRLRSSGSAAIGDHLIGPDRIEGPVQIPPRPQARRAQMKVENRGRQGANVVERGPPHLCEVGVEVVSGRMQDVRPPVAGISEHRLAGPGGPDLPAGAGRRAAVAIGALSEIDRQLPALNQIALRPETLTCPRRPSSQSERQGREIRALRSRSTGKAEIAVSRLARCRPLRGRLAR